MTRNVNSCHCRQTVGYCDLFHGTWGAVSYTMHYYFMKVPSEGRLAVELFYKTSTTEYAEQ